MAESNQTSTSSSPPPPSSMDRDASGAASSSSNPAPPSSSSSSSQVQEEEEDRYRDRDQREQQDDPQFRLPEIDHHNQHFGFPFRASLFTFDDSMALREDTWSCVIVVLTFWFFVSMTMILGVYGPVGLKLGPYCSVLIQPNPWFVQSIKVERLDDANPGLMLYGFYRSPSLNVVRTWSKTQNVSVPADSHKEWAYFLNKGSHINISYVVNSTSSSVFLIIAEGNEDLAQWLQDPTYPNTTLSWNVIHGTGIIQQNISQSSSYYVALGNLNSEDVEVKLTLGIRSLLYNTSEAYTKCTFRDGSCSVHVLFRKGDAVALTSPGPEKGSVNDEWYVKLSYGPRWVTYVVGIAGLTFFMLVVFNFLNKFRCTREEGTINQFGTAEPERAPLLANKDDDLSSWGSSYDSLSNGEEDLDSLLAAGSIEGKPSGDGENGNSTRRLCAICFDAPRDCFFLPCGHCVACFDCGTRIAEAAGTCPICRRNMKKVRKIFTV